MSTYRPLLVIIALITLVSFAVSFEPESGVIYGRQWMWTFMAGFFLVFAGFKLLDVAGFAKGFAKYDLLAMHWKPYGYLYPFIELILGLLYLHIPLDRTLNLITMILMLFGAVGVSIKLAKREQFQCACLGTFINVPLTKITLVEDLVMAGMAGIMMTM